MGQAQILLAEKHSPATAYASHRPTSSVLVTTSKALVTTSVALVTSSVALVTSSVALVTSSVLATVFKKNSEELCTLSVAI